MAELKRNFSKGSMNKDADERIVPNGQYRDATNIQVLTSDGSDSGTLQTLLGNVKHNAMNNPSGHYGIPTTATCVGSIAAPDKDKLYYFVSAGDQNNSDDTLDLKKDYILEYDFITETHKYVFVDIYDVKTTPTAAVSTAVFNVAAGADSPTINKTGIRIGMVYTCSTHNIGITDNITVTSIRYNSTNWEVTLSESVTVSLATTAINFVSKKRILNFRKDRYITGLNILDDFIFWTDNFSEPKKISITRSILGTGGEEYLVGGGVAGFASATITNTSDTFIGDTDYFHTRLVIGNPDIASDFNVVTRSDKKRAVYVEEKHATVIRISPTQPLELEMSRTEQARVSDDGTINPITGLEIDEFNFFAESDITGIQPTTGSIFTLPDDTFNTLVDIRVGDVLLFTPNTTVSDAADEEDYAIRALVISSPVTNANVLHSGGFVIEIQELDDALVSSNTAWYVRVEGKEPLFEYKFPRFSYRYKYQDGEYSTFAPFSQVAFLPDTFSYDHENGYNLGMSNQLRSLKLKGYYAQELAFPSDIVEIDLLYKETNNPTVYTVKTIKSRDGGVAWPDLGELPNARGEFEVTTDMIHAVVPSNQLMRVFDNVPRKALAQEISANRLIYGNYLQNHNTLGDPGLELSIEASSLYSEGSEYALPSVKSMRSYQVGVVFSDDYGRETPVLTSKKSSIRVPKSYCAKRNRLKAKLGISGSIPQWAKYYSFYVKETSDEYYTLIMDRWYNAEDGNIWISFPSSERNKVDENTFITLKGKHGVNSPVTTKSRYKILAIENEAPDVLKTFIASFGVIDETSTINNPLADSTSMIGSRSITIPKSEFESTYGEQLEGGNFQWAIPEKPKKTFIKFSGADGEVSEDYEITRIAALGDDAANGYSVTVRKAFAEDVIFMEYNNADGNNALSTVGVTIDIFKKEIENKPEFEGKFFIKIHRDLDIIDNVILTTNSSNYTLIDSATALGYINNNGYVNAGTGSGGGQDGVCPIGPRYLNPGVNDYAVESDETLDLHPTENTWSGQTAYCWGGGTVGTASNNTTTTAIIPGKAVRTHPVKALNSFGEGYETNPQTRDFWEDVAYKCKNEGQFFIDACTAYGLTGAVGSDNIGDYPGNEYDHGADPINDLDADATPFNVEDFWEGFVSGDQFVSPGVFGSGGGLGEAGDLAYYSEDFAGSGPSPGSFDAAKGQPSRGIWNLTDSYSLMDISWSGMGPGYDEDGYTFTTNVPGSDFSAYPYPLRLESMALQDESYLTHWNFIKKLTTPGTKFKFKRDPDNTVYTVLSFENQADFGYGMTGDNGPWNSEYITYHTGAWGIKNFFTLDDHWQYIGFNARQRWTLKVIPKIGTGEAGYNPIHGTDPNVGPLTTSVDFRRALHHDNTQIAGSEESIQILKPDLSNDAGGQYVQHPGIWETEPKKSVELDIYYQASGLIPIHVDSETNEELLPIGTKFELKNNFTTTTPGGSLIPTAHTITEWTDSNKFKFTPAGISTNFAVHEEDIKFTKRDYYSLIGNFKDTVDTPPAQTSLSGVDEITLFGEQPVATVLKPVHQDHMLDWSNCWCFGNGLESDRIRDDFNAPQLDNGVKASTVIADPQIREERRKHGIIFSGIYNSINGTNNTNQFIIAENITKELNPTHGSIQALSTRDQSLVIFCEDKVLRAVTNKDALYNADGNPQLVSSNTVIGDVQAYQGNFGISKNPESLVTTPYRSFFTDALRGQVLSLSSEGIRSISNLGMRDYFSDILSSNVFSLLGTYDTRKNEYNITVSKKTISSQVSAIKTTVSFSELANGWSSFKSFKPQHGVSINNSYYTFNQGQIYKHHDETSVDRLAEQATSTTVTLNQATDVVVGMLVTGVGIIDGTTVTAISGNIITISDAVTPTFYSQILNFSTPRNYFYDTQYTSDVTMLFNDSPEMVKSFTAINYEGTQAKITEFTSANNQLYFNNDYSTTLGVVDTDNVTDAEYFNLNAKLGWYVDTISTNLQTSSNIEFKSKEDKWFGFPTGETTSLSNIDEKEFSVQGIGNAATIVHGDTGFVIPLNITVSNNISTTYAGNQLGTIPWDLTAD